MKAASSARLWPRRSRAMTLERKNRIRGTASVESLHPVRKAVVAFLYGRAFRSAVSALRQCAALFIHARSFRTNSFRRLRRPLCLSALTCGSTRTRGKRCSARPLGVLDPHLSLHRMTEDLRELQIDQFPKKIRTTRRAMDAEGHCRNEQLPV